MTPTQALAALVALLIPAVTSAHARATAVVERCAF
jgi:hypothetical protein